MKCPIDGHQLHQKTYEGITIDVCNNCGGEFLDAEEIGTIVRIREEIFPKTLREREAQYVPHFGIPTEHFERTIHCPNCDESMEVMNYSGDSGVFVDRCPKCQGIWLDHEELERVQIYVEAWESKAPEMIQAISGDLENARLKAAERCAGAFKGSRFSFVNALINYLIDAA